MKLLIIGSNGYLGRHLAQAAREKGWHVATSDIQDESWDGDASYVKCDIRNADELQRLDYRVDAVLLFTGLSGTTAGFDKFKSYIDVNESGLVGILECLRKLERPPRLVFPSTRLVYRGVRGLALKEDAPKDALTIYAVNKQAAELYLELYRKVFGVPYTIFRICVPYGNRFDQSYSYGTTGFFLRHARDGKDIPIYGDGAQRRTFTHVADLCAQVFGAIQTEQSLGKVFNVGGGDHLSLAEAASLVARRFGVGVRHVEWPSLDLACESGDTVFDSSAVESLTGYRCTHSYSEWVQGLPLP